MQQLNLMKSSWCHQNEVFKKHEKYLHAILILIKNSPLSRTFSIKKNVARFARSALSFQSANDLVIT